MSHFHQSLIERNRTYASWHESAAFPFVHWALFALVGLILTSSILDTIDGNVRISELTAAASQSNVAVTAAKMNREPAQDHILVKFKDTLGTSKMDQIISKYNLKLQREVPNLGIKVLKISPNDTPEEIVNRLESEEGKSIDFAEVDSARQ